MLIALIDIKNKPNAVVTGPTHSLLDRRAKGIGNRKSRTGVQTARRNTKTIHDEKETRNIQYSRKTNKKAKARRKQARTKANAKAGDRPERCTRYEERHAQWRNNYSRPTDGDS